MGVWVLCGVACVGLCEGVYVYVKVYVYVHVHVHVYVSTLMKERYWTNRVAGQWYFSPCFQTGQRTSNSTGVLSLVKCSHPAFPVVVVSNFSASEKYIEWKFSSTGSSSTDDIAVNNYLPLGRAAACRDR